MSPWVLFRGVSLSEVQETNKKSSGKSGNILYPLFEHIRVVQITIGRFGLFNNWGLERSASTVFAMKSVVPYIMYGVHLTDFLIIWKEQKKIGRRVKKSPELLDKQFRLLQEWIYSKCVPILCKSPLSFPMWRIGDKSHVSQMSPLSQFLELVVFIRQYLCFRSVLLSTLSVIYSMSLHTIPNSHEFLLK